MLGEPAAGDLQQHIADEEDAAGGALRRLADMEVVADPGERVADIGPVHERYDVDHHGDRNEPEPACHADGGCLDRCV